MGAEGVMAAPRRVKPKWQLRNSVAALLLCIDIGAFTWYLWSAFPDNGSFDHTTKVITTVAGWVVSLLAFLGVKSATRKQSFAAFLNLLPVQLCTLAITVAVCLFVLPIHGVTISVVAAGTRRPLPEAAVILDAKRFQAGTDGIVRLNSLFAASHHLKVEHDHYNPQETTVAFEDVLSSRSISVALNARRGTIIATSDPSSATVYLDGDSKTVRGSTPFTLDIEAGPHRIEFAKPGFQPTEWQEFEIEGGQQTELKLQTLQRQAGPAKRYQVMFASEPSGAAFEVDGTSWGKTPRMVPLTQGPHTVRYRIDTIDCATETIQVPPYAHSVDCRKHP